jgi:ABC-type polysaccharide/polyol phosphate transport system ATPase subunit
MSSDMEAIVARGITKTYRAGVGRARVREMLPAPTDRIVAKLFPRWWTRDTFNALEDVWLSVESGSSVGIVGHNGAGKTTLLKVISGVTAPTNGHVRVAGRVAALIDMVVGFHPELTGRENVSLFGILHGFGRREMVQRIDRIFEFAEIDELADTPVKRYSAGMAGRLGFATIAALDVDILLIDEVLAVGDAAFQRKCIAWLHEYRERGGTLLFVSHNLGLVRSMTHRAIWIDHGHLVDDGPTSDILPRYARASEQRDDQHMQMSVGRAVRSMAARGLHRWGAGGARVEDVHIRQESGASPGVEIEISYDVPLIERAVFCVGFVDESGRDIGAAVSPTLSLTEHRGTLRCSIRPLPLRTGVYFPVVAIISADGAVLDRWRLDRAVVVDRDGEATLVDTFGPVDLSAEWSQESEAVWGQRI